MSNKNSDDASMTTTAELDLDEAVSRILKSDDGHRILKDALFADHKTVETLISYNRFGLRKDVGLASIDAKIERYKIDLKKDNVLADEIDRLKDIINRLT